MSETTNLYRAYDTDGTLLYIGIAKNWGRRWSQHSERAPWFTQVARLHVETFPDRASAAVAELEAIAAERPVHNIVGNRGLERTRRTETMATPPQDPTGRLSLAVGGGFSPTSLVGSFFLAGPDPGWQGCVVAEPAPGAYLVEFFSWVHGQSTNQQIVSLQRMIDDEWQFYDTAEWLGNDYDHGVGTRWERAREKRRSEDDSP